jgi:starch-binding outer membrane protein, SusD/RagB family
VHIISLAKRATALAFAFSVFGACKDSTGVPELNNLTQDAIANGLDRSSTQLLLTGLLDRDRGSVDQRYMVFSSTMGRDIYRLDSAEPRYVTEILVAAPDAGGFVGGAAFTNFFNAVRTANTILDALPTTQRAELAPQFQLSNAEIKGVSGVAKTIKAQALYRAIEMRDTLGIPIKQNAFGEALADFVCKKNVLAYIATLLDDAQTDLGAAGSSFYFPLPAGFSAAQAGVDLTKPAGFTKYNRALKGKVELYRGLLGDATAYARALTALNASYLSTTASLNNGPVYTYSAAPGETTNPTFDNNIVANPKAEAAIDPLDTRKSKFASTRATSRYGFTAGHRLSFTRTADPTNQTRPRRVLSNEELILLRAQVEIEQNDFVNATADINTVRQQYGLAAIPLLLDKESARTAVLYEKRYSLFFEGAQRIVDLRAYGRFNPTYITPESANGSTDPFVSMLPIPKTEVDQRGGTVTKTCS